MDPPMKTGWSKGRMAAGSSGCPEWLLPEQFCRGATTTTSPTLASSPTRAPRPGASMPSSLVTRRRGGRIGAVTALSPTRQPPNTNNTNKNRLFDILCITFGACGGRGCYHPAAMELIVILLGELLFAPFIAAMILVLEIVALAIGAILDLVGSRVGAGRPPDQSKVPRRWSGILLWVAGGLAVLTFSVFLVLDLFCFTATTRWIFDRIERTTHSRIDYDTASGSLFGGRLRLDGLSIRRTEGPRSNCDLRIQTAELRLSIWTLLDGTIQVDSLRLETVRGSFTRLEAGAMSGRRRSTKAFEIQELTVEDLDLEIADKTRGEQSYRLAVASWRSEPLRSLWLPFDILLRTNCAGTIAGADFQIRSKAVPDGRETRWQATNLPGWYLARELSGPFALIQEGRVDVQVDDRWRHGQITEIDSRWRLLFHSVRAEVPDGLPLQQQVLCKSWVTVLNKLGSKVPLEFRLTFDGSRLTTYSSPEAKPIWAGVGVAMIKKLLGGKAK